jgi:hypothetical protein
LVKMRVTCAFTVVSERNSSAAISELDRPRPISYSTSTSRSVSSGGGETCPGSGRLTYSHDFDVGLGLQDHPDAAAYERLVIGDQDADHAVILPRGGSAGSSARTCQPPPGAGPAVVVPPKTRARWRMPTRPWQARAPLGGPRGAVVDDIDGDNTKDRSRPGPGP